MRTTGSTMSRFDKHRAVKDNAVRGNPPTPTKRYTALQKCGFSLDFNIYTGSKKAYLKNTNFYQSSNNQDFQGFAPFEPTEAVLVSNTNKLMI